MEMIDLLIFPGTCTGRTWEVKGLNLRLALCTRMEHTVGSSPSVTWTCQHL